MSLVPGLKLYDLCQTPSNFLKRGTAYGPGLGPVYSFTLPPGPDNTHHVTVTLEAPSTVQRSSTFFLSHISESYGALL